MDSNVRDLGRYRLIAELARGGMGEVYLAIVRGPAGFNKLTVVKVLKQDLAEDEQFLVMFLDEARLSALLRHPNIVQTNEVDREGNLYFIAMEYLEGQSFHRLRNRLMRNGTLSLRLQLQVICETLAGLHYAHELSDYNGNPLGVVHRDVTPQNVFVTYDGQVKLLDFGIAKAVSSSHETRTGVIKGKVAYMAPEQARGDEVDRRVDIFSVGVMLWEAVTERRYWEGVPEMNQLHRLITGDLPQIGNLPLALDGAIVEILQKALAPEAHDRYSTALQFQGALEAYASEISDRSTGPRGLGRIVSAEFEKERNALKAIIDGQMRALHELPPTEFERLNLVQITNTLNPQGLASDRPPPVVPAAPISNHPSGTPSAVEAPSAVATALPPIQKSLPPRRSGPATELLILVAVILSAGVLVTLLVRHNQEPTAVVGTQVPSSTTAPEGMPAAPPTATASNAKVRVRLAASPPQARLFLDRELLPGNPYEGTFASDSVRHLLRVEAAGYKSREVIFSFERDAVVDLSLERDVDAPPGAPTHKTPSEKPSRPERPSGKSGGSFPPTSNPATGDGAQGDGTPAKPKRAIDKDSPYGP